MVNKITTPPSQNEVIDKVNEIIDDKYDASNPAGYTSNVGTVTSVNNTLPDANGNVTISTGGNYSAGSGIDITNDVISVTSPTLTNTATGTGSYIIGGTNIVTGDFRTSVGRGASGGNKATNIGAASTGGDYSVTVGYNAIATNNHGIQIGEGRNTEANCMYVGTSSSNNWKLLGSDGLIPDARISSNIARASSIPTVDQTYDGTSANAQSGVAVASAISSKASKYDVVKLTGNQTLGTGKKDFTDSVEFKNGGNVWSTANSTERDSRYRCKFYQYGLSDNILPSSTVFGGVHCYDKNNFEYGTIFSSMGANGTVGSCLWVHTPNGSAQQMGIYQDSFGGTWTTAPTPATSDNSGQIATTSYVKSNLSSYINYNNITNCITEIPQDIKLELNNGTLTLKAGSKVYVPNGFNGTTPKFDVITIASDLTHTRTWGTKEQLAIAVNADGTYLSRLGLNRLSSGPTAPTETNGRWWYDTTSNKIKDYSGGSWTNDTESFPIAIVSVPGDNTTTVTSIDQVFNGFGYIGSTVFALPGVKGLIPNGRNKDGSLKNTEVVIQSVLTKTISSNTGWHYLSIKASGTECDIRTEYYQGSSFPTSAPRFSVFYNHEENLSYLQGTVGVWSPLNYFTVQMRIEPETSSPYKITSIQPVNVFHALDYNDSPTISGWSMPSDRYIDLTLGASGASYTAPANGWFCLNGKDSGNTGTTEVVIRNQTRYFGVAGTNQTTRSPAWTGYILPAKKGDIVYMYFSGTLTLNDTNWSWRFYYTEGEA